MQIEDPHFSHIVLVGFVRYSLTRSSYFVGDCGELLRRMWHSTPENTRQIIATNIAEALYYDDCSIAKIKTLVAEDMAPEDCSCYRHLEDIDRRSWELTLEFIQKHQKYAASAT
jgi:hypothetical protein